eukprot:13817_3
MGRDEGTQYIFPIHGGKHLRSAIVNLSLFLDPRFSVSTCKLERMGDTWTDEFGDPVLNTGFRVTEHVPGYTGFIPKMQHIHSLTFTTSTKVAMSCHPTPDLETVKNEFTKAR